MKKNDPEGRLHTRTATKSQKKYEIFTPAGRYFFADVDTILLSRCVLTEKPSNYGFVGPARTSLLGGNNDVVGRENDVVARVYKGFAGTAQKKRTQGPLFLKQRYKIFVRKTNFGKKSLPIQVSDLGLNLQGKKGIILPIKSL